MSRYNFYERVEYLAEFGPVRAEGAVKASDDVVIKFVTVAGDHQFAATVVFMLVDETSAALIVILREAIPSQLEKLLSLIAISAQLPKTAVVLNILLPAVEISEAAALSLKAHAVELDKHSVHQKIHRAAIA